MFYDDEISKFIILPGNYWYMQVQNFVQVIFIVYVTVTPMLVSFDVILSKSNLQLLLLFDIIFLGDKIIDLFVGYYDNLGKPEKLLWRVLVKNFNSNFLIESGIVIIPLLLDPDHLNSIIYFMLKIPRYIRFFEMENCIAEYLAFYGQNKTVFEITRAQDIAKIIQFSVQTAIILHLLACTQIMLCTHRDFTKSWMSLTDDIDFTNYSDLYICAMYFVCTTLSTCGFGDFYATPKDPVENLVILILQFVGMLFYSYTIQ